MELENTTILVILKCICLCGNNCNTLVNLIPLYSCQNKDTAYLSSVAASILTCWKIKYQGANFSACVLRASRIQEQVLVLVSSELLEYSDTMSMARDFLTRVTKLLQYDSVI